MNLETRIVLATVIVIVLGVAAMACISAAINH